VVAGLADDDVALAVAVDVAGRGQRLAELSEGLSATEGPGGSRAQPRRRPEGEEDRPLSGLAVVTVRRRHDHVGLAVVVDAAPAPTLSVSPLLWPPPAPAPGAASAASAWWESIPQPGVLDAPRGEP